jgi:cephalosporin-C deacetylase-like acetyl esterase
VDPKQQIERYRFNQNQGNIDEFKRYWDESLEALVTTYADLVLDRSNNLTFDQFLRNTQKGLGEAAINSPH